MLIFTAQIGPPEVHLEPEDKAVIVNISPPGTKNNVMWATFTSNFIYSVDIWNKSSSAKVSIIFICVRYERKTM